jgi:hypothetical protein
MEREEILERYKMAASARGRTIGKSQFFKDAGVKESEWMRYWPRISEMQKEAGFEPNDFQDAIPEEQILEAWAKILETLGKFPTHAELRIAIRNSIALPADNTLRRIGTNAKIAEKVIAHLSAKNTNPAAIKICELFLANNSAITTSDATLTNKVLSTGYVYLLRLSGSKYKIGKTGNLDRRLDQHRRLLPDLKYTWKIETDDPSGIEAYWKRRFADKLEPKTEETFNLSADDVASFKRWIRIV